MGDSVRVRALSYSSGEEICHSARSTGLQLQRLPSSFMNSRLVYVSAFPIPKIRKILYSKDEGDLLMLILFRGRLSEKNRPSNKGFEI